MAKLSVKMPAPVFVKLPPEDPVIAAVVRVIPAGVLPLVSIVSAFPAIAMPPVNVNIAPVVLVACKVPPLVPTVIKRLMPETVTPV